MSLTVSYKDLHLLSSGKGRKLTAKLKVILYQKLIPLAYNFFIWAA